MSNPVNTRRRYPGPRHFESAQSGIFFGRSTALKQVMEQIELRPHLVLYGKSGLGKSSLVNAGLLHALSGNRRVVPFNVRFGAHSAEENQTPLSKTRDIVSAHALSGADGTFLSKLKPMDDVSLWFHLKQRQILSVGEHTTGSPQFLLVFDQFEELFTYPEADIERFAQQISELLFSTIPLRFRQMLDRELEAGPTRIAAAAPVSLSVESKLALLERPLDIRLLFVIREDRMSLLNKISGPLPDILKHCYELQALDMTEAQEAIMSPAYLRNGSFESPIFDYRFEAVNHILNALTDGRKNPIESFQLQILCQSVEEKVIAGLIPPSSDGRIEVDEQHIGDPKQIYEEYYEKKIQLIADPAERLKARIFIEEGLIYEEEGRRLSLYEGVARTKYQLSPELLKNLTDTYLIRAEAGINKSGYSYELSHDTLVEPVLKAKAKRVQDDKKTADEKARLESEAAAEKARLEQEKEIADLKAKAEQERQQKEAIGKERDKAVRARKWSRALAVAGVVLAIGAGIGWAQAIKSQKEAGVAKANSIFSQFASKANELTAKESEKKVKLEKAIVAAAKNNAEEATRQKVKILQKLYKSNQEVAARLAQEAEDEISRLNYAYAVSNLTEAFHLAGGNKVSSMQKAIVETAFFYAECNNITAARDLLNACGLGTPALTREDLRTHLRRVDAAQYEALRKKYYPDLVPVPGGTFEMGCVTGIEGCEDIETPHPATVGGFQIAKTETTFLQYNLFCSSTGRTLPSPSWGYESSDPIVNVSWFDALEYANWVSQQLGLAAPYTLGTKDGENTASLNGSANGFRLPTEAEWEYAARGGANAERFRFSGSNSLDAAAWYSENSTRGGLRRTHPVRSKKLTNQLGLYDMTGNVWEWCWDWYAAYPDSSPSGYSGPANGLNRILRGGSFESFENESRVTFRNQTNPYLTSDNTGFRLVRGE